MIVHASRTALDKALRGLALLLFASLPLVVSA